MQLLSKMSANEKKEVFEEWRNFINSLNSRNPNEAAKKEVLNLVLTYAETNLSQLKPDGWVNLEADILGKYVEKLMISPQSAAAKKREIITSDFLAANGYQ